MAKSRAPDLTAAELRELVDYDPLTGILKWRWRYNLHPQAVTWNKRNAGNVAGQRDTKGYLFVSIYKISYRAHRLAWAHYYGEWPSLDIDHINRVKDDNRICNLRLATVAQNGLNVGLTKRNTSGVRGVFWHKGANKWQAGICYLGQEIYLGLYVKLEDAIKRRREAEDQYYGEYAKKG